MDERERRWEEVERGRLAGSEGAERVGGRGPVGVVDVVGEAEEDPLADDEDLPRLPRPTYDFCRRKVLEFGGMSLKSYGTKKTLMGVRLWFRIMTWIWPFGGMRYPAGWSPSNPRDSKSIFPTYGVAK